MDLRGVTGAGGGIPQNIEAPGKIGGGTGGDAGIEPGASDVERFQAAMTGDAAEVNAAGQEAPSAASLGEEVLNGLGNLSEKVQTGREKVLETMNKPDVSQADLLGAQMSMIESSTLVTAASKVTDKITQAVKNLQQG